jgi:acyl carrier protein
MPRLEAEEVFEKTREILVDTLGVDDDEVTLEASLINDLGAESIDFLDISFRIEKAFGVKFPEKEIAQIAEIAKESRMKTLSEIMEDQYQVKLSEEEKEGLAELDTQVLIERLSERYKIKLKPGTIERGIQSVATQIIEHLKGIGFVISANNPQEMIDVTMDDNPRSIQEKVARMFTVQSLVDFVVASQAARS